MPECWLAPDPPQLPPGPGMREPRIPQGREKALPSPLPPGGPALAKTEGAS